MDITVEELEADGFRRAGTVAAHPDRILRVDVDCDLAGFIVYIMVVNREFKKAGTTGRKNSRLKSRMGSTFSALRQVIIGGPPYLGDPFKQHAPHTILANQQIDLWAQEFPSFEAMMQKETALNTKYEPEWTKEGRARLAAKRLTGRPSRLEPREVQ